MISEDDLHNVLSSMAGTMGEAPVTELRLKFELLQMKRDARDPREVMRQHDELQATAFEQSAYEYASEVHARGDLHAAAYHYRLAAVNDFADAPLRLAQVLDATAAQYLSRPATQRSKHEELSLVTDAAHWYLVAYVAGDLEADEVASLLDDLLTRHPTCPRQVGGAPSGSSINNPGKPLDDTIDNEPGTGTAEAPACEECPR